jgi:hypothetical protein
VLLHHHGVTPLHSPIHRRKINPIQEKLINHKRCVDTNAFGAGGFQRKRFADVPLISAQSLQQKKRRRQLIQRNTNLR